MKIVYRPPHDLFTMRLFSRLTGNIETPNDRIYVWSVVFEPNFDYVERINRLRPWPVGPVELCFHHTELEYRNYILDNINKDLVFIGVKDHLTWGKFNPWTESMPNGISNLIGLFDSFPDKRFVLFTSLENLDYYIKNANVSIIPWGGDITNQMSEYKLLSAVTDKDLDSPYTFVCLNRGLRPHRVMAVSLLHGLGLADHGMISCMFQNNVDDLINYTKWMFDSSQSEIKDIYISGFEKFKESKLIINDDVKIYGEAADNNNIKNFNDVLCLYYRKSFVEIVNETSFTEKTFNLTEKTMHSFYGMNFPILISSQGTVEFLRNMGLDMFDDVIDHSYDKIKNPIDRLYRAIYDNRDLLSDHKKTKSRWQQCHPRFINNVNFLKKNLHDYYNRRAELLFRRLDIK